MIEYAIQPFIFLLTCEIRNENRAGKSGSDTSDRYYLSRTSADERGEEYFGEYSIKYVLAHHNLPAHFSLSCYFFIFVFQTYRGHKAFVQPNKNKML